MTKFSTTISTAAALASIFGVVLGAVKLVDERKTVSQETPQAVPYYPPEIKEVPKTQEPPVVNTTTPPPEPKPLPISSPPPIVSPPPVTLPPVAPLPPENGNFE